MSAKIDGDQIAFKAGNNSFTGTVKSDRIELQRSINLGWEMPKPAPEDPGRPAIGPAADGSDPSIGTSWRIPESIPMILRRVERS
jgi:beta-galactosidase